MLLASFVVRCKSWMEAPCFFFRNGMSSLGREASFARGEMRMHSQDKFLGAVTTQRVERMEPGAGSFIVRLTRAVAASFTSLIAGIDSAEFIHHECYMNRLASKQAWPHISR